MQKKNCIHTQSFEQTQNAKIKTFLSKYSSQSTLESIFFIFILTILYQYFIFKIDITILPPWFWKKKQTTKQNNM